MFDVDGYLTKLGYTGTLEPTAENLRTLHKLHMMRVPFDNSANAAKGLGVWDEVDTDLDILYQRHVVEGRGGVCHELSGVFRGLLRALGYQVTVMSAGVRGANDEFGPDLEHMLNVVELDGETWLADVGFAGPGFIEPIRLSDEVQHQYGFDYRVVDAAPFKIVERRTAGQDWHAVYRFRFQERALEEWKAVSAGLDEDPGWHWAGEMIAAGTLIHARAFETGQLLLVGRRFLTAEDGKDQFKVLVKPDAYQAVVDDILLRAAA